MRVQDPGEQPLGKARGGPALQLHVADASFDHGDLHRTVADRLLGQIGLREEVAARAVIRTHLGRRVVQSLEIELLADELLHHLRELLVAVQGISREGELRDAHLERRRDRQRGFRLGRTRANVVLRRRQAQRLALLLEKLSRIGCLLGDGDRA